MSPEEFDTSQDFEPGIKEEVVESPEEEEPVLEEPTEEELELEPAIEAEEQEVGDDPVRLYLHEIGRVQLLTANDEKTIARRIELGKRISEIRRELEKQGKHPSAAEIFLVIIRQIGQWSEFIRAVMQQVGIPSGARFKEIVTSEKLHRAIDGVLDQTVVQALVEKMKVPQQQLEQQLIALSVDT